MTYLKNIPALSENNDMALNELEQSLLKRISECNYSICNKSSLDSFEIHHAEILVRKGVLSKTVNARASAYTEAYVVTPLGRHQLY